MYAQADRVSHHARYPSLSHSHAQKLVALHREWLREIERELSNDVG